MRLRWQAMQLWQWHCSSLIHTDQLVCLSMRLYFFEEMMLKLLQCDCSGIRLQYQGCLFIFRRQCDCRRASNVGARAPVEGFEGFGKSFVLFLFLDNFVMRFEFYPFFFL